MPPELLIIRPLVGPTSCPELFWFDGIIVTSAVGLRSFSNPLRSELVNPPPKRDRGGIRECDRNLLIYVDHSG